MISPLDGLFSVLIITFITICWSFMDQMITCENELVMKIKVYRCHSFVIAQLRAQLNSLSTVVVIFWLQHRCQKKIKNDTQPSNQLLIWRLRFVLVCKFNLSSQFCDCVIEPPQPHWLRALSVSTWLLSSASGSACCQAVAHTAVAFSSMGLVGEKGDGLCIILHLRAPKCPVLFPCY